MHIFVSVRSFQGLAEILVERKRMWVRQVGSALMMNKIVNRSEEPQVGSMWMGFGIAVAGEEDVSS